MDIEQAFERHRDAMMAIPGVTGVGIGEKDGRAAIVVMVRQYPDDSGPDIPETLEGYPVAVEQSGDITAF